MDVTSQIVELEKLLDESLRNLPPEQRAMMNSFKSSVVNTAKRVDISPEKVTELIKMEEQKFKIENGI